MHKIVIVKIDIYSWSDNYGDDYNEKLSSIIPESEWMEVDDEEYYMYATYCNWHGDYKIIELHEYKSKPKPLTEDSIKEWYNNFLKKQKADEEKKQKAAKKAQESKEKNATEKKKKQLEKLAKELGVKIEA